MKVRIGNATLLTAVLQIGAACWLKLGAQMRFDNALAMVLGLDIRILGDMGQRPDNLPIFLLPDVPLNLTRLQTIFVKARR